MKSILTNKYLKSELEMQHFIDTNNNVMVTELLHGQIFNSLFGKTVTMMLVLLSLIISTAIGAMLVSLINISVYIWSNLTSGYKLLELIYILSSFASFVMFSLFFYEKSKSLDKKAEEIEKKNRYLQEENFALKLILQKKEKT